LFGVVLKIIANTLKRIVINLNRLFENYLLTYLYLGGYFLYWMLIARLVYQKTVNIYDLFHLFIGLPFMLISLPFMLIGLPFMLIGLPFIFLSLLWDILFNLRINHYVIQYIRNLVSIVLITMFIQPFTMLKLETFVISLSLSMVLPFPM